MPSFGDAPLMTGRSDRFFAWIWRINGVLVLALAGLGVVLATTFAVGAARVSSHHDRERQLTSIAGADLGANDLRLGDFRTIAGTRFLYAELASRSSLAKGIGSYSSDWRGAARNLLFFDVGTKKAHWLLPNNDQTIESFSFLMHPPTRRYTYSDGEADARDQAALAILVELQRPDPAVANRTTRSLAMATPDGRALVPIAASTEGLLGYHQPTRESVLVFYVAAGAARVLDADPATGQVRSDALLEE
jgi:hypothetical protein